MASGNSLIIFTPLNNEPPAASFATLDTRNSVPVLDFDSSADESAVFSGVLPTNYAGGGLTLIIVWMCTSATSGTCTWEAAIERHEDDAFDIDADGFAAANTADGTAASATGEQQYTDITFTDGADMDSLAAGESFRIKITRNQDSGTDDIASDVELLKIHLKET